MSAGRLVAVAALAALVAGCGWYQRESMAYHGARSTPPLAAPPELTLPPPDPTYRIPALPDTPRAAARPSPAAKTPSPSAAASAAPAGPDITEQREGALRWLAVARPPAAVWPVLRAWAQAQGGEPAVADPVEGVLKTAWRDAGDGRQVQYRLRLEPAGQGSTVYLTAELRRDGRRIAPDPALEARQLQALRQYLARHLH